MSYNKIEVFSKSEEVFDPEAGRFREIVGAKTVAMTVRKAREEYVEQSLTWSEEDMISMSIGITVDALARAARMQRGLQTHFHLRHAPRAMQRQNNSHVC